MRERRKKSDLGGLLALLLLGVFAVCVLSVLLTGAEAYRRLTARDQASFDRRTAAQYVATKVRQADAAGGVAVGDFQGCDALELTEDAAGYVTRVYCYDGWLRELFCAADADLAPRDGEPVLEAADLTAALSDGTLTVDLTDGDGGTDRLVLALRSGEGAAE